MGLRFGGTGGKMLWRPGKAYSHNLRQRVFVAADEGTSVGGIAVLLRVSVSYVSKVLGRRHRTGETTARRQRGHVPAKLAGLYGVIRANVAAHPDITLAELQAWLTAEHEMSASLSLLSRTLRGLGLTVKKSRCGPVSRTVRMSAAGIFGPVLVNYIRQYNVEHGVAKAQAYNTTMYVMAVLLVVGFFCNLAVRRVHQRHHMQAGQESFETAFTESRSAV